MVKLDEIDISQFIDSLIIELAKVKAKNEIKHKQLANIRMKLALHKKRLKIRV